jgi:hypothetical protein
MKNKNLPLIMAAVTVFLTGSLFAAYDPAVNPLDPGFETISVSDLVGSITFAFEGRLDYDVYAPGEYNGDISTLSSDQITVPINHYVYQYQITSTSGYGAGLFIALTPGSQAENFGYAASLTGSDVIPANISQASNQALYSFFIADGQQTSLLLFTSPNAPGAGNALVSGAMAGTQAVIVPVPVPEPVTLVLLGAGCLALRYRKRSRKAA